MPQAIPFVVGALATSIAVEAGIVIAGSIGAALIGAGASLIASPCIGRMSVDAE